MADCSVSAVVMGLEPAQAVRRAEAAATSRQSVLLPATLRQIGLAACTAVQMGDDNATVSRARGARRPNSSVKRWPSMGQIAMATEPMENRA